MWNNAWQEFIPFLDYGTEIRRLLCSTNAIESLDPDAGGLSRLVGTFPPKLPGTEMPLSGDSLTGPDRQGQARWITRWKPALNAFAITFADRWPGSETY